MAEVRPEQLLSPVGTLSRLERDEGLRHFKCCTLFEAARSSESTETARAFAAPPRPNPGTSASAPRTESGRLREAGRRRAPPLQRDGSKATARLEGASRRRRGMRRRSVRGPFGRPRRASLVARGVPAVLWGSPRPKTRRVVAAARLSRLRGRRSARPRRGRSAAAASPRPARKRVVRWHARRLPASLATHRARHPAPLAVLRQRRLRADERRGPRGLRGRRDGVHRGPRRRPGRDRDV